MPELPQFSRAPPLAGLLLTLMALGELGVGVLVLAFPTPLTGLLLAAPMEGVGLVVTRMAGIAIAALGLTWWRARRDLDQRFTRVAPGFLVYNLGVGLLFLAYALTAIGSVPLAWIVAAVHLLAGLAFAAALLASLKQR
jgi:hypothetical protein